MSSFSRSPVAVINEEPLVLGLTTGATFEEALKVAMNFHFRKQLQIGFSECLGKCE